MTYASDTEEVQRLRERVAELESELAECRHSMDRHAQVLQHFEELSLARAILESGGDGVIVVDDAGNVVYANPAARQMVGDSLFDLNAFEWAQRRALFSPDMITPYKPEDFPLLRALQGEVVEAQEVYIHLHNENRGLWLSITAMPITSEDASLRGAFVDFRNITERKRAEQELHVRGHAMASSAEGISISDPTQPGNPLVYVNAGFERLTGYDASEVLGKNCRFLQGKETDPAAVEAIRAGIREERPCMVELINYRKDGTKFWNRLSITPVRDASGKVIRFIGIQSDITDRKETEARLAETSRRLKDANERMKRNLQAAAAIQKGLLPSAPPQMENAAFAWHFEPSEELSGDLFNVFQLDERHVGLFLLDVSGHGVASSLLSVSVNRVLTPMRGSPSIVLRRITGTRDYRPADPDEVAQKLADAFPWDSETGQFFTIVYGVMDCETRVLRYICAGHPAGIRVSPDGSVERLPGAGLPIGLHQRDYECREVALNPGDRLYFHSDGLSEALNSDDEVFGDRRLLDAVTSVQHLPLDSSVFSLVTYVRDWCRPRRFVDDVTLLAVEIS